MAGPGGASGNEIGRVTVRVVPDATGFGKKTKTELQGELAGIDEKVPVKADATGEREKVKAEFAGLKAKVDVEAKSSGIDRFQQRLLADLKGLASKAEATIPVNLNGEELRRSLSKIETDVGKSIRRIPIGADLEVTNKARQKALVELQKFKREAEAALRVKVEPDYGLRNQGSRILGNVDKLRPKVELDYQLEKSGKKILESIEKLRPRVELNFDYQLKQSGDRILENIGKLRPKVDLDFQTNLLGKKILANVDKLRVPVELDLRQNQLLADIQAVQKFAELKIPATAQGERLLAQVKAKAFEVEKLVKIKLPVEPDLKAAKVAELMAQVEGLRLFTSKGFGGLGLDLLPNFAGLGQGLAEVGPKAGSAALGLASFGAAIAVVVALIALIIPPILAFVAGLTVMAPALLALLAPIGAVALGMDGIKKAAEAAGLFGDSNGAKKGGGGVGKALDDLKKKVNDTFEQGLKPAFENIASIAENKTLQNAFASIATGLSDMATGFTKAVSSKEGIASLSNIFSNIQKGLSAAAPGIQSFTQGILNLVSALSNKFQGVGKWFSDLGQGFSDWVTKFTTIPESNGLTGLQNTLNTMKATLGELGSLFKGVFSQGLKDVSDPNFGNGMVNFIRGIKEFVLNTLPALSSSFIRFADTISAVLGPLGQFIALFDKITGAARIFANLPGANLLPGIAPLKDALNALDQAGTLSGGTYTNVIKGARPAGQEASVLFGQGWQSGPKLGAALGGTNAGGGMFGEVPLAAAQAGVQAGQNLTAGIQTNLGAQSAQIGQSFAGVFSQVQAQTATLAPAIGQQVTTAVAPIQTLPLTIGTALAAVAPATSTAMAGVATTAGTGAQQAVANVQSNLSPLPSVVSGTFGSAVGQVSSTWGQAGAAVSNGTQQMLSAVQTGLGQIPGVAASSFAGMVSAIAAQMQVAVSTVASLCQVMVQTAIAFGGAMEGAGRSIGLSFAAGISSTGPDVASAASGLMAIARALFPNSPAKTGPFSGSGWVDKSGAAVGQAFGDGIQGSTGQVTEVARVMMQQVKDVFGNANGIVFNFNFGDTYNGMARGMSAVNTQMTQLNTTASTFKDTLNSTPLVGGQAPDGQLNKSEVKQSIKELSQSLLDLEIQRKQLELQKDALAPGDKTGRSVIQSQLSQINNQKTQLGLQKDQLTYAQKYGGVVDDTKNQYKDLASKYGQQFFGIGQNVVQSTLGDLGISGQGAIPSLINQGLQYGSKFVFNVSNMDDALSAQQNLTNRDSIGLVGR